jgi:nucleotide-binding universal stress UspA family protein
MKILLSVDDDPALADVLGALDWSIEIGKYSEVLVVHVTSSSALSPPGEDTARAVRGENLMNRACRLVSRFPLRVTRVLARGDPAQEIVRVAETACAELIVLGARGEKRDFFMGSVVQRVVTLAPTDILVVRGVVGRAPERSFRALVAVDGSLGSEAALDAFARKLRARAASIRLIHVLDSLKASLVDPLDSKGDEVLGWAYEALERRGLRAEGECRRGDPAGQILEAAREGLSDMIVLGSRGHSAIREMVLGGVTHRVLRHAPCNVLCARGWAPQSIGLPRRWLSESWEPGAGMA